MGKPLITCDDVTLAYGREVVLSGVSLEIPAGAFLPFVGPNGAGKTTLLRAILGLVRPRRGTITNPFDRTVAGYVPQNKVIDPIYPVPVRRIVAMGLYPELGPLRRAGESGRKRVADALEMFSLTEHADKTFDLLSGGMKQKVMLARAFASGAEVFVMDEPTSELDAGAEHAVLEHLHGLTRDHGKTVLFAHHGINHITGWSTEVCLVERGKARLFPTSRAWKEAKWIRNLRDIYSVNHVQRDRRACPGGAVINHYDDT